MSLITKDNLFTFLRDCIGPAQPGMSWNFILTFPGKWLKVLESLENLLNSSNKVFRIYVIRNVCTQGRIDFEILGIKVLKVKSRLLVLEKFSRFVSEKGYKPCSSWFIACSPHMGTVFMFFQLTVPIRFSEVFGPDLNMI